MQHLMQFYYQSEYPGKVSSVDAADLFPGIEDLAVVCDVAGHVNGEVSPTELDLLCRISKYLNPSTIFEIGTFTGNTTFHLALNTDSGCRIYTLDLPWGQMDQTKFSVTGQEDHIRKEVIGERFLDHPVRRKIEILLGDSATFDFSRYSGLIDMIFVDGSHTYDYIASDTANALTMLSPTGVILFHDFLNHYHEDVTRFLYRFAMEQKVYHIRGTTMALLSRRLLPIR